MTKMTNTQILETQDALLSELERQMKHVLRVFVLPKPGCPNCHTPVDVLEASGLTLDAYPAGTASNENITYACPTCKRELKQQLAFLGGYVFWTLVAEEKYRKPAK